MSKDNPVLGKLLDAPQPRDAVHIAIASVVAQMRLNPGQPIGFSKPGDAENVGPSPSPIGIVDPFLTKPVAAGQRFWMFLYPNTITSLRHNWTHPAFEKAEPPMPDYRKMAAEKWMHQFAGEMDMGYDEIIAAGHECISEGGYSVGDDMNKSNLFYENEEKFWDSFELVTGATVSQETRNTSGFSCAC